MRNLLASPGDGYRDDGDVRDPQSVDGVLNVVGGDIGVRLSVGEGDDDFFLVKKYCFYDIFLFKITFCLPKKLKKINLTNLFTMTKVIC